MKRYAVIVAGGTGSRMQSDMPKQFMMLREKPVLYYSIKTFSETFHDCEIILVLPEANTAAGQEVIDAFFDYSRIRIVEGGRTRFHSVQNGLAGIDDDDAIIFVHDAARPLVTADLLRRANDAASVTGTAIPVTDCADSMRVVTEEGNEVIAREILKKVQTPQAFHSKILLPAYKIDYKDKYTDEATVVEAFGMKVTLIPGEEHNLKLTSPTDFLAAEQYFNGRI